MDLLFLGMPGLKHTAYSLFAFSLFVIACHERQTTKIAVQSHDDIVQVHAPDSSMSLPKSVSNTGMEYIEEANIGRFIKRIDFGIKASAEEQKIFTDGIIPWISLDSPGKKIDSLYLPDEIVLDYKKVILIIDYPIMKIAYFQLTSANGFSRRQLINSISDLYHTIYREESRTTTDKEIPPDQRKGLLNRNQTNGKYGIWGHDLSDLDLSGIHVYKNDNGEIYLSLDIES